jgi:hypothetical protein
MGRGRPRIHPKPLRGLFPPKAGAVGVHGGVRHRWANRAGLSGPVISSCGIELDSFHALPDAREAHCSTCPVCFPYTAKADTATT